MKTNLEIIQDLYTFFKEKDYDSFRNICDEKITWNQNPGFPKGSSYKGADEIVNNVFRSFDENWKEWKFKIIKIYDAGATIIVTGLYEGRHKLTGKTFVSEAAHIYDLKDGKIVTFQQYADSKVIWDAMQ